MVQTAALATRQSEPHANNCNTVRILEIKPDPYAGMKGHDYIRARNLSPPVQRVQTSAHAELVPAAEACK